MALVVGAKLGPYEILAPIGAGWRNNGQEILYLSPDYKSMSAEIRTGPTFQASPPRVLFQNPAGATTGDITRDGKRLLLAVPTGQSGPMQFTIVENWQAGLKK